MLWTTVLMMSLLNILGGPGFDEEEEVTHAHVRRRRRTSSAESMVMNRPPHYHPPQHTPTLAVSKWATSQSTGPGGSPMKITLSKSPHKTPASSAVSMHGPVPQKVNFKALYDLICNLYIYIYIHINTSKYSDCMKNCIGNIMQPYITRSF